MKLTKFAFTAIVATLVLWASNVKAGQGIPVYEKLNFSLTVAQQDLVYSNSAPSTYISTFETAKINNKDLLSFLATAFNTNWPTGARLVLNNLNKHIFVVDKTGTNPVFDVSMGINDDATNVVYFAFDYDRPVFKGKEVNKVGGRRKEDYFGIIFLQLFSEHNGITTTDLRFQGFDAAKLVVDFGSTKDTFAVTDVALVAGDGTLNDKLTVVKGKVTGSGKSKVLVGP